MGGAAEALVHCEMHQHPLVRAQGVVCLGRRRQVLQDEGGATGDLRRRRAGEETDEERHEDAISRDELTQRQRSPCRAWRGEGAGG